MGGNKPDYLVFTALEDGTFAHNTAALKYSIDGGSSWVNLPARTATPVIEAGKSIMWKGTMTPSKTNQCFISSGRFNASGNPLSIIFKEGFDEHTRLVKYGFYRMFQSTHIVDASKLVLTDNFDTECFGTMFYNCKNLTIAPKLPATTLTANCYQQMFQNCTNLITAPSLPATTLAERCYENMFLNCSGLVNAPSLPATTLETGCYNGMFGNCINLINAPELPAVTLVTNCYKSMFYRCSKLHYVKAMFTTTPDSTYTPAWLAGVSNGGTFVKNSTAQWDVRGDNGVPNSWTIETAAS